MKPHQFYVTKVEDQNGNVSTIQADGLFYKGAANVNLPGKLSSVGVKSEPVSRLIRDGQTNSYSEVKHKNIRDMLEFKFVSCE